MRIALILLIPVLALIGCGQKGPLYLPTQKPGAPQPSILMTPDPERPTPAQAVPPPK